MKELPGNVEIKKLSSKELREIVNQQDTVKTSVLVAIVVEILEWCFAIGIIFLITVFTKPIWQGAIDLVSGK